MRRKLKRERAPSLASLRRTADDLWRKAVYQKHPRCILCGRPASPAHHFFPKKLYGHLRYDLDNGISLCIECHFRHHTRGDPLIAQRIITTNGQDWYKRLLEKARQKPISFRSAGWYRKNIEQLRQLLADNYPSP